MQAPISSQLLLALLGAKNFKTGTNSTEISWENFQKIQKLLNFQKANHSTEKVRKFQE